MILGVPADMPGELRKSNLHENPVFRKAAEKGGLFDVGPNDLDDDIGHPVRFPDGEERTYYAHEHPVVAVQYDHKGDLAYRVQLAEDAEGLGTAEEFGRGAPSEEVEYVDEESGRVLGDAEDQ